MTTKAKPFSTFDLAALVGLVALVGSISGAIMAETFREDPRQKAVKNAESLARQIFVQQNASFSSLTQSAMQVPPPAGGQKSLESSGREPASAEVPMMSGALGLDPWGHPFHYLARKVRSGNEAHAHRSSLRITVWSDGPNGQSESETSQLERNTRDAVLALAGDDVGFTQDFPVEP